MTAAPSAIAPLAVHPGRPPRPPQDPFAAYQATSRFGSLNGLRALAVLAVVYHHTNAVCDWLPLTERGFLGVDLFFAISGFLIVTLLLRERGKTNRISLRNFYIRRTLRIFPVYYAQILVVTLLCLAFYRHITGARLFLAQLPYLATYTSDFVDCAVLNFGVAWSLAVEEQFYCTWPTVEKIVVGRWIYLPLLVVLALNLAIHAQLFDGAVNAWTGGNVRALPLWQVTFTPILLGVLLAHLLHQRRSFLLCHRLLGQPWMPIVVFLAVLAGANFLPFNPAPAVARPAIQLLLAILLASCVLQEDHLLRPILAWPLIARVGLVSYGMYLFHMWALHILRAGLPRLHLSLPNLALFPLAAALTFALAAVSFRFFETPWLNLRQRFRA